MNSSTARIALATLTLTWNAAAMAQPSDEEELALVYGDQSFVSIATGSKQSLRRAPAVASVITAEDIAAMGATDLDEVLETVAGMHVSHSANAYVPIYTIRGIYSLQNQQTLMLQNGIPTTTIFLGSKGNAWGGLPLENVARIEIIRGPGSALYGADAYAGVINLITKTAADTPGTTVGARVGAFGTKDAWVQRGGQWGAVDVAAYLRVGSTDGIEETIAADAQSRFDTLFGTHASLAPGQVYAGRDALDASLDLAYDKWRWRTGYKLRDKLQLGAGLSSALDPFGLEKSERITSDLSWTDPHLSPNWGAGCVASVMQYNDTIVSPLVLYPAGVSFPTGTFPDGMIGAPEKWERNTRLSAFATYAGFHNHQLRFGIGHDDLNLYKTAEHKNFTLSPTGLPIPLGSYADFSNTNPFMRPQRRRIDYFYAQDEWNFTKDWTLTAGVRHDRYSDFGGTTNPRLALVWDASLDLTAKLLYGRAFRAPSFAEQYTINPVINGNSALKPETIETLEAVFAWQARKDTRFNLSLFHYEMQDIIRAVPNPAPAVGSTYNNTGNQYGNGLELEAVWDVSLTLRLTGNYSYQKSIDEASGKDAGYAPHHHLYARADWRYPSGWFVSAQLNRVAERLRAAGDNRPRIPDYTTVDLTVRTNPGKGQWGFAASLRNLFDATVLEPTLAPGTALPFDLPMAPRALWVQASYRL